MNQKVIDRFIDEYSFLSNFYKTDIIFEGYLYKNSEAAFQAQKDLSRRQEFTNLTGFESRRLGKKVKLRSDWEDVKLDVMFEILKCKFNQNPDLKEKLLGTEDALLIEGNNWNDRYWGVCRGKGKNNLGKLLMKLREEFRK